VVAKIDVFIEVIKKNNTHIEVFGGFTLKFCDFLMKNCAFTDVSRLKKIRAALNVFVRHYG